MNTGSSTFFNVKCNYVQDGNSIIVIPKNNNDIKELNKNILKKNLLLEYQAFIYKKSYLFVKEVKHRTDNSIGLNIKYQANLLANDRFDSFTIQGDEIDVFFSPIDYYFNCKKDSQYVARDLLYNKDIIDTFKFRYCEKDIYIDLYFGDILSKGISSDLRLHPKLEVQFESTNDIEFVYEIYNIVKKFLRFICYKSELNLMPIDIYRNDDKKSKVGSLFEKEYKVNHYSKISDINYTNFKPHINKILQLIADDKGLYLRHLPIHENELFYYDVNRYLSCFAAFEYECNSKPEVFNQTENKQIENIRMDILDRMDNIDKKSLSGDEKSFLNQAKERVCQLGTQFGQVKKITNAYEKMESIFCNTPYLIYNNKDVKVIARELTTLRAKIAHDNYCEELTSDQIENIRFLEILAYSMLLKRAEIDDNGIELIIGSIFKCNYLYTGL